MKKNRANSKGFTLVETAIVLVIGGIILTMLFDSMNTYMQNMRLTTTRERLKMIENQIGEYFELEGQLPCPALPNETPDVPNYAKAAACASTLNVRVGMVPVRTLNLPDEVAYDGWGNRIVYAVTERLATPSYDNIGRIIITDSTNNVAAPITSQALYILVGLGANKNGARNINGLPNPPACVGNAQSDQENCDNDNIFKATLITSDGPDVFDDVVLYQSAVNFNRSIPAGATVLFRSTIVANCDSIGWTSNGVPGGAPAGHIYCRKP